ncbi:MAG: hypothetical protein K6G26_01455, partial [Lachnospiraceae bacterium]|nr:hypothetical protein [Lachnospiraceae bacterium]
MKNFKRIKVIGFAALFVLMASGCSKNSIACNKYIKTLPSDMDDEIILYTNEQNQDFIRDFSPYNAVEVDVISKEPLNKGDVVLIDSPDYEAELMEPICSDEITGKFNRDLCLCYNNFNWKSYKKAMDTNNSGNYIEMESAIYNEYDRLKDSMFPTFYHTKYTVQFKLDKKKWKINELNFEVKGKKYTVDIGEIRVNEIEDEYDFEDFGYYMNCEPGTFAEYPLFYSKKGIIG